MPYIKKEERDKLSPILDPIIAGLNDGMDFTPGELNYFISKIIWTIFDNNQSYTKANTLVGVLECVKQEFIRRKVNIYETNKMMENGDI